jgi:hypothetical protein
LPSTSTTGEIAKLPPLGTAHSPAAAKYNGGLQYDARQREPAIVCFADDQKPTTNDRRLTSPFHPRTVDFSQFLPCPVMPAAKPCPFIVEVR